MFESKTSDAPKSSGFLIISQYSMDENHRACMIIGLIPTNLNCHLLAFHNDSLLNELKENEVVLKSNCTMIHVGK